LVNLYGLMNSRRANITFQDIKLAFSDLDELSILLDRLKTEKATGDEMLALQYFLEQNNYDPEKLIDHFEPNQEDFDALLEKHSAQKRGFSFIKVAAMLIPLISIGFLWFYEGISENEKIFDEYFQEEFGMPVTMRAVDNIAFYEAMNIYRDGDYKRAFTAFEKLQPSEGLNDTLDYFMACSLINSKCYTESMYYFNKIDRSSIYFEKAQFYMALVFLYSDDMSKASETLQGISKKNKKALKLLAEPIFEGA